MSQDLAQLQASLESDAKERSQAQQQATEEKSAPISAEVIKAKSKDTGEIMVTYNLGNSLQDMAQLYGEDVVHSLAKKSLVVAVQDKIRPLAKAGKTSEEAQAFIDQWKPGMARVATGRKRTRKTIKIDQIKNNLSNIQGLTPELAEQILATLGG